MARTPVFAAASLAVTLAGPAFSAAVESLETPLPDPPPGKAEVQVLCRQNPVGLLSDCRGVRAKPEGYPILKVAAAKVEGASGASPAKGVATVLVTVEVELPLGPPPAHNPETFDWASKPTALELYAAYPPEAMEQEITGAVTLSCRVTPLGAAYSCLVVYEKPAGKGFGQGALKLVPKFRLKANPTVEGQGGSVLIPMGFGPAK